MEILIIGVIIVALMAYVSTRIKKSAASAYEPENIDTAGFTVFKPEGFLNPVDAREGLAFYAYSKDYGIENTAKFRQSEIKVRVYDEDTARAVLKSIKNTASRVLAEKNDGKSEFYITTETSEDKATFEKDYKIVLQNGKTYELEVKSLQESKDDYAQRIAQIIESFAVK